MVFPVPLHCVCRPLCLRLLLNGDLGLLGRPFVRLQSLGGLAQDEALALVLDLLAHLFGIGVGRHHVTRLVDIIFGNPELGMTEDRVERVALDDHLARLAT